MGTAEEGKLGACQWSILAPLIRETQNVTIALIVILRNSSMWWFWLPTPILWGLCSMATLRREDWEAGCFPGAARPRPPGRGGRFIREPEGLPKYLEVVSCVFFLATAQYDCHGLDGIRDPQAASRDTPRGRWRTLAARGRGAARQRPRPPSRGRVTSACVSPRLLPVRRA